MRLKKVLIELKIQEKINKKHGIHRKEIEDALFEGNPLFFKTTEQKYIALTHKDRYMTIIFTHNKDIAKIITAYRSSNWQIKLYKKKKLRK